jgi:hypothetical protein
MSLANSPIVRFFTFLLNYSPMRLYYTRNHHTTQTLSHEKWSTMLSKFTLLYI